MSTPKSELFTLFSRRAKYRIGRAKKKEVIHILIRLRSQQEQKIK